MEALLERHVPRGRVLDPFAGSGTTLVQALESGLDACGADVASFNCLLMRVKTREYNPFEMVTPEKQRRLRRAAETWLAAHPETAGLAVSFEVVAVRDGRLERLRQAF